MNEFLKADALEHLLESFDGNAFLMFVAFHFIADQVQSVQNIQNRINHRGRPGHNQRAAWREDSMRLAKHLFGLGEMLQNGEHHDVIELAIRQRQRRTQISAHALPAALHAIRNLIVDANARCDAVRRVIQKSGFQTAAEIADARTMDGYEDRQRENASWQ